MRTSQAGVDLIKRFEGLELCRYICPAGIPTIGYGHVILPHEQMPDCITEQEAENILKADLMQFERAVNRLIRTPLTQEQFDALVSFAFNLGPAALQRSTLRQKLNRGEYDSAANEFRKWVYAGGRRLRGLVRRREAERELFLA